jgi:hypothetical protein
VSHDTGSVPATRRAADWRDAAACREVDPDLFHPAGTTGPYALQIAEAKSVCRRCPVRDVCLDYAFTHGIDSGIFGGLTEQERRATRRASQRRKISVEEAKARRTARASRPTTMRGIFNASATPLANGHAGWTGPRQIKFEGRTFTPKRFVFILDRGRAPDGPVTSECGITSCILPAHLKDQRERSVCGTRSGYQRHQREKTEICGPCRRANADADNRLRRIGTTLASV